MNTPSSESPYRATSEPAVTLQADDPADAYCGTCHAQICVRGLPADAEVRCSGCGTQFGLDTLSNEAWPKNTKATISAVLGSLSFIGLFLTGIPAVILGVRALKDIRDRKTFIGRKRAVIGIATGSIFGLFCSVSTLLLAILIPTLMPKTDAASIAQVRGEIGTFELPEGVKVHNVQSTPGIEHFRARDQGKATLIWMVVVQKTFAPNEAAARAQFLGARMTVDGAVSKHNTHEFKIYGGPVEVVEERGTIDGEEVRVFTAVIEREKSWLLVFIRSEQGYDGSETEGPKKYSMDATAVKEFLKTYLPPLESEENEG